MSNKTIGYGLIGVGGAIGGYLLWKNRTSEPPLICTEGTTKCVGDDEHTCINNAWYLTGLGACAPGQTYVTWVFTAPGYWPQHLPDDFTGEIVLDDIIDTVPLEDPPGGSINPYAIDGVYWYDPDLGTDRFWAPGAPGNTLTSLVAGRNYMIACHQACEWEISLI